MQGGRLIEPGEWIQNRNGVLHVLCVRHWTCARKERVDISGEWIPYSRVIRRPRLYLHKKQMGA